LENWRTPTKSVVPDIGHPCHWIGSWDEVNAGMKKAGLTAVSPAQFVPMKG
jgi:hypothetical protein